MSCEAIFCYDTATVRFAIYPDGLDGTRVISQISEHALRDYFGARGGSESLIEAYARHAAEIDLVAIERYRSAPSQSIVLQPADFDLQTLAFDPATMAKTLPARDSRATV